MTSLQRSYPHFYVKQKVMEEFVHLADEAYRASLYLQTEIAKRPGDRKKRLQLGNKVGELEKSLWLSLAEYAEQDQALIGWMRKAIRATTVMVEDYQRLVISIA